MTPLEILLYAGAIGIAIIIVAICAGVGYMIYYTAVQKTHEKK